MLFSLIVLFIPALLNGVLSREAPAALPDTLGPGLYAAVLFGGNSTVGASNNPAGLFSRADGDTAWTHHYRPNLFTFGMTRERSTGYWYIAAGNGLHRSTDGGRSWRVLTSWQTEEVLSVELNPVHPDILYISTPFGVFKSIDDGATWEKKMTGMKKWYVQKVVMDRNDPETLYAACEDDLYVTRYGANQWQVLQVGTPGILEFYQLASDPNVLLVGTEDDGLIVSHDNGKSWKQASGIPQTAIYGIASSVGDRRVYAGGFRSGLWVSEDRGKTWRLLWNAEGIEAIFTIFVDRDQLDHLIIGTLGQGLYESFDGGRAWKSAGLAGASVRRIESYP